MKKLTFDKLDSLITQSLATTGGGILLGGSIYGATGAFIGGFIGLIIGCLSYYKGKNLSTK